MSHCDIAVIGAGAAGLAAGLTLQDKGMSFIVLEARDRIGGRAWTDTECFPGIAFDRGGHWLHAAAQNPFTKIADQLGIRYSTDMDWSKRVLFTGGEKRAGTVLMREASSSLMGALERVTEAGEDGKDIAFTELLDPNDPWELLNRRVFHQITSHEPEDCSALDYARYVDEGGDFPVEDGFGTLVARNAVGLPVTLSTPVTRIDWSGKDVKIETSKGTLGAKALILAVPVNVLLAGGIHFTPELPVGTMKALHDCPMGVSEKFAVLLDRPIDGLGHVYGDVVDGPPVTKAFNLHINPFRRPMLISHFGGGYGRELIAAGEDTVRAIALDAMAEAFGSGIRKRVIATTMTNWVADPFTLGGYSHARPGRAASRLQLAEPIGGRIVLAGEHCSIPFYSTIHGAHVSGIEAAERASRLLA
jgi:monoamine oxidase